MRQRFINKTIVVTGAAQGIGEAVMRQLLDEGAFVYALDVNQEKLAILSAQINRARVVMEALPVNISLKEEVDAAVDRIRGQRPIDGLVNGAGVLFPCSFETMTAEAWINTFNINVHGTFFVSHSVARQMIDRRSGVIVTIASNAGATPRVNMSAYCAAKAATAMLTKCMGLELGKYGIRCNVVSPGSTNTQMLKAMSDDPEDMSQKLIHGDQDQYRTGIPLRKIAEPEDIAKAVVFLLSDEANHITLHDLVVDGGATL